MNVTPELIEAMQAGMAKTARDYQRTQLAAAALQTILSADLEGFTDLDDSTLMRAGLLAARAADFTLRALEGQQ